MPPTLHHLKASRSGSFLVTMAVLALSSLAAWHLPESPDLNPAARVCLMIFFSAALLWIWEVIPSFATSLLIIGLNILILGMPGGVYAKDAQTWKIFVEPALSPVIFIFFAGFTMARVLQKYHIDGFISTRILRPFARRPKALLGVLMLTTATLSMFMSNTATTAMMFAILTPLLLGIPDTDVNFKKGLCLSIPFSANIGGIGTLIGTPPNGIAQGMLIAENPNYAIGFLEWMVMGIPFSLMLLALLWAYILKIHAPTAGCVLDPPPSIQVKSRLVLLAVSGILVVTFALWVTGPWTGIPVAVASFFPVVAFCVLKLFDAEDLKSLDWNVIFLITGGLSLSTAMQVSGAGQYLIGLVPVQHLHPLMLTIALLSLILLLSNFMSHSAAAAMLLPLVVQLDIEPIRNSVFVAIGASLSMSLPISTPPNAIAYSTGLLSVKDFIRTGTLVSLVGVALLMALSSLGGWLHFPGFLYR